MFYIGYGVYSTEMLVFLLYENIMTAGNSIAL